ncbi:hypothetical protein PHYBLDRAFT_168488 [Phycomyces blakesleeanus NRRL 1555(-)]|uniref:Uncharacterized protein n=1 Tax=Phycomyces blakesleeanus (strain ATCC 8743b / DSM 1359 / FGSC 10004 / NBRC 33097 / NRRL 1555) TaxID=763407 RepID=A0A162X867_PHYB8|nr:hypothetical protein PHYBLDRAFT_168488 [Phycomyces blakesleeanus NRRL 1555(-)]OAD73135.1 hypothetical protein PHYBLDRAFT_168488 [Phycomyces blakesleeanus NRRL 1555(-)]|eukprot:XP_018291175.1 hypothetical protein PHYBLDRAFT_168488 [Phycomyces blakesleeanus NRRL 1555(-)]
MASTMKFAKNILEFNSPQWILRDQIELFHASRKLTICGSVESKCRTSKISVKAVHAVLPGCPYLQLHHMFQDHNISIKSGEAVSDATSRAIAANNCLTSDFSLRIDLLVHNPCYNIHNEHCCIKFKRQDARTGLLTSQQSKSIRINGAILNDLIVKTNADDIYLAYIDFWGSDGYIAGMKLFENLALCVFKEKRKYETVDISRLSTPICLSPERVPEMEPLNMYYSPKFAELHSAFYQLFP